MDSEFLINQIKGAAEVETNVFYTGTTPKETVEALVRKNFIISKNVKVSYTTAYFLILYSLFRFFIEFLRLPDSHIGYLMFSWVTMGQILCIPMFFLGLYILKIRNGD